MVKTVAAVSVTEVGKVGIRGESVPNGTVIRGSSGVLSEHTLCLPDHSLVQSRFGKLCMEDFVGVIGSMVNFETGEE